MAAALVEQGVTQACCTPHTTDWATAGDEARIRQRVAELQETLDEEGIGLKLLPGSEAHLSPALAADIGRRTVASLNGSQYLLLEFPYDFLPPFFERVVFELRAHGVCPVIAHPERIAPIAADPSILYGLVRGGCLAQLTAMSLAGGFGPRVRDVSELMLEHRLIHAIASDAHDADPRGRLFALRPAREAAKRLLGMAAADDLFETTPARIVAGQAVDAPEPVEIKKRHFGFLKAFR
jgi:protein-tyrosine phosphatase